MSTLFLLRERFGEKDDNWKSTTTDFSMNLGWKKMSKEIQWQLNFVRNDNNQQRKNLTTKREEKWNYWWLSRLLDVVGVRRVNVVGGEERLWMIVECGCEVPPTDNTTNTTTKPWRQGRRRTGLYLYNLMQDDVNFMHNSSRHQQFKLPSPAGAEQALGGASDD